MTAHPQVEPLWTGPAVALRAVLDLKGVTGAFGVGIEDPVAVVPWPLPAPTREQILQAILDVRVPPGRPGAGCQYQALSERGEIPGVVADAVLALLSGQATEEDSDA